MDPFLIFGHILFGCEHICRMSYAVIVVVVNDDDDDVGSCCDAASPTVQNVTLRAIRIICDQR